MNQQRRELAEQLLTVAREFSRHACEIQQQADTAALNADETTGVALLTSTIYKLAGAAALTGGTIYERTKQLEQTELN